MLSGAMLAKADFWLVVMALPHVSRDLGASGAQLELIAAAYAATYAVLLVLAGRLGDSYGRRRLFVSGMAVFTVASVASGLSPTPGFMIAARAVQGLGAAMLVPQVLATIQVTTTGSARLKALSWFSVTGGSAILVGQLVGALVVAADIGAESWRPVFFVCIPITAIALVFGRNMPESRAEQDTAADVAGTLILGLCVTCLLVGFSVGQTLSWPWWSLVLLVCAPGFAWALALVERRVERKGGSPILPRAFTSSPGVGRGIALNSIMFVGFGGFVFVYAVVSQGELGWGPLEAAEGIVPFASGFLLGALFTARLVAKFGYSAIVSGMTAMALGYTYVLVIISVSWSSLEPVDIAVGMVLAGFGQGLVTAPLVNIILIDVPRDVAGVGGAVVTTAQQISLAIGAVALGSLYSAVESHEGARVGLVTILGLQVSASLAAALLSLRFRTPAGEVARTPAAP